MTDEADQMRRVGATLARELTDRLTANGHRISFSEAEHEMLGKVAALAMIDAGWRCERGGMILVRSEAKR